ncbi:MAG: glycosyltransferase family 39 protein [Candidatus Roizmanbacteria bacterium]|nr:glycosyltransferase family 39 protein [Candidatus Roizmanbacteria bacterium]
MIDILDIISSIKKRISKQDVLFCILLLSIFITTRVINLTKLPIFTDEAIYIHWAKLAWKDAGWRFVSLTDGRQPLQTWATIPLLKLFEDPLFAGRMFGVVSGIFSFAGFFTLIALLFGKRYAYISALLYIFNPYFLFYERMALVDALVNGFFIWFLIGGIVIWKYRRLDTALVFGLIAGMALLSKSTIRVFFPLLFLLPFFMYEKKDFKTRALTYYTLMAIVIALSLVLYNIQRLSPFMQFIEQKNTTFILSIPQFLSHPLNPLLHNLRIIPLYALSESALLGPIVGMVGLLLLYKKRPGLVLLLFTSFFIPFLTIACLAMVIFPRYLIFLTIPFFTGLIYLAGQKKIGIYIIIAFLLSTAYMNWAILFSPSKIPFPPIDRGQYIEGYTAGYGINDMVARFKKQSAKEDIYVFTEGTFGLLPYAFDIYTAYTSLPIHYEPRWPVKSDDFIYAQDLAKKYPVYFVFAERDSFPTDWPISLVKKYPKPFGPHGLYLYKVQPE